MTRTQCQFYVTLSAVEDFARLEQLDTDPDDGLRRARELLTTRLRTANFCRRQQNGLQLWRLRQDAHLLGRKLPRYRVLVSTERRPDGNLPQVVQVLPEHERHPR